MEPGPTARARVIERSEQLGFPPDLARRSDMATQTVSQFRQALLGLAGTAEGRAALDQLQLDGVVAGEPSLFDGLRACMRDIQGV